jgi:hypothetical protein
VAITAIAVLVAVLSVSSVLVAVVGGMCASGSFDDDGGAPTDSSLIGDEILSASGSATARDLPFARLRTVGRDGCDVDGFSMVGNMI